MKEQLISFETAKLAKEKGFNWKTNHHFELDTLGDITSYEGHEVHHDNQVEVCKRPSQSLLQKWLRGEHEIHITVKREDIGSDEWNFTYVIDYLPKDYWDVKRRSPHFKLISPFRIGYGTYCNAWDTYEEALEAGLKKGLELIPKSNKQ